MADTRRRVKLYALNADRQWDDRGTGHVSSSYVERLKAMSLLVRAESDGSLLLESKIQQDTAYQKQQETLIVWSEGDNYDLALSFQEKAGCDEIWEKICQVQGKDPSVDITQDVVESEDEHLEEGGPGGEGSGLPPVELPPCETSRLGELAALVQSCLPSPVRRDKLAQALEEQDYVRRLLPVFRTCEELDYREGLHQLYDIFKGLFLLNKNALFDAMFAEEAILDVVGVLEYEPSSCSSPAQASSPASSAQGQQQQGAQQQGAAQGQGQGQQQQPPQQQQRRRHRDYLRQVARFREVIPLGNPELLAKIHQTYRVQYIQDVVLPTPSVFEENMLSTLSSFIFFNKADIVSMLQEDEKFLSELFAQLTDDATDDDKRRDLVLFLKEFCTFSQTLQPQCRESFFKTLSSLGILQALEITLGMDDAVIKTASIDILSYLVDYSPSMVREYAFQQSNVQDDDQLLINIIIDQMVCDPDPDLGGAVQLSGILRLLLDPENMLSLDTKSEFLNFFYKHCMHVLIAPVLANTTGEAPSKETSQTAQLLGLIVELLSFCVEHHSYHIKNYVLHKDLLRRVLVLMRSKFTFLVLCALRFMRRIVGLKDEFYNRYIINGNLFGPVVDAFRNNNGRYNLLDSAVLELFEFIRVDDVKSLCLHVVERYGKVLDKVEYVQTFKSLRLRYEQHQERMRERPSLEGSILRGGAGGGAGGGVVPPGATLGPNVGGGGGALGGGGAGATRFRRDPRQLEEDEEMWFNEEEEEEEELEGPPGTGGAPADSFSRRLDAEFDQLGKILDKKAQEREGKENVRTLNRSGSPVLNNSPGRRSPSNPAGGPLSPTTVVEVKSPTGGALQRKGGLVDYPDEDSDEEEEEEEEGGVTGSGLPSAKRPRLSS
ncbi:serine/threonine-protein phosphatase 4 regulatory subunit 3 flfl isoform X1 [Haemaphysalis longicornis]